MRHDVLLCGCNEERGGRKPHAVPAVARGRRAPMVDRLAGGRERRPDDASY
ncbi:uncharacterized protein BCN122_II0754 [Burkholderia cenocepacia]|nr:uncharacterized protein BCN122_II0754 [Burkholderia cenocepacia]